MSRTSAGSLRWILVAALLLGVAGCGRVFSSNCSKPAAYASAHSLPPLKIPVGLDAPDRRAAMKIPDLREPEAPRAPGDPCLDEPPKYSSSSNLGTAPGAAQPVKKKHWWSRG
jgi:hypothetical protein